MILNFKLSKVQIFSTMLLTLFGIFTTSTTGVKADTASNTDAQFSITPHFTSSQTDTQLGYYHMRVKKGKIYHLRVRIFNNNKTQNVHFQVQLCNASNTAQGQITYASSQKTKTAPHNYKSLTSLSITELKKKVLIPAHSYKDVLFKFKVPAGGFKGTIVGGIYVTRQNVQAKNNRTGTSNGITNTFSMTLPIFISQNFMQKISPVLLLKKTNIFSSASHVYLTTTLLNNSPVIFGKTRLNIELSVHKKTIYKKTLKNIQMAPYSELPLVLQLTAQIKPHKKYLLIIEVHSGNFTKKIVKKITSP